MNKLYRFLILSSLAIGVVIPAAHAFSFSHNLDFTVEVTTLDLSGQGLLIPLGQKPVKDYLSVPSLVVFNEDPARVSTIRTTGTISGDLSGILSGTPTGNIDLDLNFGYNIATILHLTDQNGTSTAPNYTAGVPTDITMDYATGNFPKTLNYTVGGALPTPSFPFPFTDILYSKVADLGVDVNGNGENDYLEVMFKGFTATVSMDLFSFDFAVGGSGIKIGMTASEVLFQGNVGDVSTDPPFGPFLLTSQAIPEPPTLLLTLLGLAGMARCRKQHRFISRMGHSTSV